MRMIQCSGCGKQSPRAGATGFRGADYCAHCAQKLKLDMDCSAEEFLHLSDPTLCAFCGRDGGEAEFELEVGSPCCPDCKVRLYRAPLPRWLWFFFAAMALVLVVCSLVNMPYYRAFVDYKKSQKALSSGNLDLASDFMNRASATLPRNKDLSAGAACYKAHRLLSRGDQQGAYAQYKKYLAVYPDDEDMKTKLRMLEANFAFEQKNWDEFYRINEELAASGDPMRLLGLASAAACLWAARSDEQRRREAEELLNRALAAATDENRAMLSEYAKRIRYRIQTSEIIEADEYYRRHPEEAAP